MNTFHTVSIVSGAIISYFKLDYQFSTVINLILMKFFENDFMESYAWYMFGCGILYIIYTKFNIGWFSYNVNTYDIREEQDVSTFLTYIEDNPDYYDIPKDIVIGDPDSILNNRCSNNNKRPAFNTKIYFNDKKFNFKGYYYCYNNYYKKHSVKRERGGKENIDVEIEVPLMHLVICGKGNLSKYVDQVLIFQKNNDKGLVLRQETINGDRNDERELFFFYKGSNKSTEEFEKIYIDNFFHVDIKKIYSRLKKIHQNPTEFIMTTGTFPRASMLFYGPPGSGKSSLINRLCITFNRHCSMVDILSFKSKKALYNTFNEVDNCKKKILVLDEFDNAIFELLKRQDTLDCIDEGINNCNGAGQLKIYMDQRKSLTPKGEDFITIEDLFTVLQGPAPVEGTIIIGTMNRYSELIENPKYGTRLQALFRPGRMTPIYFGYLCQITLNMITQHYFSRDMFIDNLESKKISIVNVTTYLGDLLLYNEQDSYQKLQSFLTK